MQGRSMIICKRVFFGGYQEMILPKVQKKQIKMIKYYSVMRDTSLVSKRNGLPFHFVTSSEILSCIYFLMCQFLPRMQLMSGQKRYLKRQIKSWFNLFRKVSLSLKILSFTATPKAVTSVLLTYF